jgi:ComF family protein
MPALQILTSLRPILEFVFPPVCVVCDALLLPREHKVCGACWKSVRPVRPDEDLFVQMHQRLTADGYVSGFFSAFLFEKQGALQSMIHRLKYEGMTSLGVELGKKLGEGLKERNDIDSKAVLIPVPLHRSKVRERGYNQSFHICKGLHAVTGLPIRLHALRRHRYTESQTHLNIEDRKKNVDGAFSIPPSLHSAVRNKPVILVDDVITTGATTNSCAQVLCAAGAEKVFACSVALAE